MRFLLVLILLSSGLLAISGLRVLLRDLSEIGAARPESPADADRIDLLIDCAMTLAGLGGVVFSLWGLGAF